MTARDPDPESNPLCAADPLARTLAALRPAPAGVDTQKLLYLAGAAARDRAVAFWRRLFLGAVAVLVAGGAAVGVKLANTGPRVEYVYVDRPAPPAPPRGPEEAPMPRGAADYPDRGELARPDPPAPADLAEYLRVRREVLTAGLTLLPEAKPRPPGPVTPAELERSLNLPTGVLTAPYLIPPPKPKPEPMPD